MKKRLIVPFILLLTAACNDLTELNVIPKRAEAGTVPAQTLFASAQRELADALTSPNVNTNIFRLLSQYWAQTTYTDESRYDLTTRNIPQNFWNALYRDVLRDLRESKSIILNNNELAPAVKQNQLAMIEIMEIMTFMKLVNTFGNVPYFQALDFNNVYPVYDDANLIYQDLIKRLDAALAALTPGAASFGGSDLIYGGDVSKWIKFGNTLKLKIGMTLADVNPAQAKTLVEQAAPNVFKSNADNAVFAYFQGPPNTNPIWVNLVQSGRKDFVVANTLVDKMNALNDPRRKFYFTTVGDKYIGGKYGSSNNYQAFSKPSTAITAPDFEALLMDYAETEFFLAEAVERGFNVEGTAAEHYNRGITASMEYWGVSPAEITAYLARPEVAYATAAGNYREKIGAQKWLALYNRGHEAWTEIRRLDAPTLEAPSSAILPYVPVRFPYPVQEQNINTANYNEAAAAVGGDEARTKLFWDKF